MVKRGFDSPSRLWLPQWGSFFMQFFFAPMAFFLIFAWVFFFVVIAHEKPFDF